MPPGSCAVIKSGVIIILLLFCLFLILNSVFSALPSLGTGMMNAVVGTSYTAEDEDILGANEDYTALENELRQKIANMSAPTPAMMNTATTLTVSGITPTNLRLI